MKIYFMDYAPMSEDEVELVIRDAREQGIDLTGRVILQITEHGGNQTLYVDCIDSEIDIVCKVAENLSYQAFDGEPMLDSSGELWTNAIAWEN